MAARIPISWLVLLCVVAVFAFFAYHIVQASANEELSVPKIPTVYKEVADEADEKPQALPGPAEDDEPYHRPQRTANEMPNVPGQTEEDLRAPEQLQATPPTTQYDPPEATDPMNRHVHSGAEFGSNLRHPEQMIERRPAATMDYVVPSGLGSENSSQGGNRQVSFAPEMAQNGGEFMSGISAFDSSESGTGFSAL